MINKQIIYKYELPCPFWDMVTPQDLWCQDIELLSCLFCINAMLCRYMLYETRYGTWSSDQILFAGSRLFLTWRCAICWCKVGSASSPSSSWLYSRGAKQALSSWWVKHVYWQFVNISFWLDRSNCVDSLELLQLIKRPSDSINSLVSSFVARLRVKCFC